MRKHISAVIAAVFFAVALIPAPTAYALPDNVTYITVRYACISGHSYGTIVGEWTIWCNGQTTGWGWQPGSHCSFTEYETGESCGFEPPEDP
jgi:hypothetical protein